MTLRRILRSMLTSYLDTSPCFQKCAPRNPAFACLAFLCLIGAPETARAVLIPNGGDDPAYIALGSQFQGRLLSLRVLVPGVGTGVRDTSAIYLNSEYALTAGHNVADLLQFNPTYEVATGDNYLTNRGTVVGVSSVIVHPSYVGGFPKNYIDLAILHLATPLPGSAQTIASVSVGDVLTSAGFGRVGTPASGLSAPQDGFSRGWRSPVDDFSAVDVSDTYYFETFFGSSTGLALIGRGASGDSGGPAYDELGNLVGMVVAGSPTFASTVGSTYYLDLSQPEVHSWISANAIVPEPSTFILLVFGSAGLVVRRRR